MVSWTSSAGITLPSSLIRTHAPVLNPPTAYGHSLGRRVFAGCRQSLLGVGPSRRYLCESFPTCLDPYPGCSCGALARSFPQDIGLPSVRTRSALGNTRTATSVRTQFRGCSHSLMFRLPYLLGPLIAPTITCTMHVRRLGLIRHAEPGLLPPQAVASLRARFGQLARLDLHQLDDSLVGCSFPHYALRS